MYIFHLFVFFSLCQKAPEGAAVAVTRARHSVLSDASRVASIMLRPVILLISSVHDVIGRPLPRLPSTSPCKTSLQNKHYTLN